MTARRDDLLARLSATVSGLRGLRTPAARLCEAARIVAGADGASLALAQGDGALERAVLWSTDPTAARLEEIHDALGDGPGFDALRGDAVDEAAPGLASRWPMFVELAERDAPLSRLGALPMRAGPVRLGVLLLHRTRPGAFAYGLDDLSVLADVIAVMLVEQTPADALPVGPAPADRQAVNRATGMVMAQLSVGPRDALALLRAHAYALDATLLDITRQVLDRSLVFRPPDPP